MALLWVTTHDIIEEASLRVFLKLRGGLRIYVKTPTGTTISLRAKPSDLIEVVKTKSSRLRGNPPDCGKFSSLLVKNLKMVLVLMTTILKEETLYT